MVEEQVKNDRYRLFALILYDDSNSYNFSDILRNLKSFKRWAYIKHQPESDEKKEHYHFLLKSDNAMTISALSKKTGVPVNYIQNVRNERSMCRYLVHIDDEDKIQYDLDEVKTSKLYSNYYKRCFDDLESEEESIIKIFNKLDELKSLPLDKRLFQLVLFLNINNYNTLYNRYKKEFDSYLISIL